MTMVGAFLLGFVLGLLLADAVRVLRVLRESEETETESAPEPPRPRMHSTPRERMPWLRSLEAQGYLTISNRTNEEPCRLCGTDTLVYEYTEKAAQPDGVLGVLVGVTYCPCGFAEYPTGDLDA